MSELPGPPSIYQSGKKVDAKQIEELHVDVGSMD